MILFFKKNICDIIRLVINIKSKFYCDIIGTYTGGTDRKESLSTFAQLLDSLDDSDELEFSFISTNDIDGIKECMDEFKPYIEGTKIKFGTQYGFDKKLDKGVVSDTPNGKTLQMINDLANDSYEKVYYADDTKAFTMMAGHLVEAKYPELSLTILEPTKGIDSLNNELIKHIENKKKL